MFFQPSKPPLFGCRSCTLYDVINTAGIQEKLGSGVDPNKWICVSAEKVASVTLDNDVVLIMGYADQVDAIMDATVKAAEGVYENIGSVINVLG